VINEFSDGLLECDVYGLNTSFGLGFKLDMLKNQTKLLGAVFLLIIARFIIALSPLLVRVKWVYVI